MATTIVEMFKGLAKKTNSGNMIWFSKVDGQSNTIIGEQQIITPNINPENGTYFSYAKLENSNLVFNTFFGKIISAGQENQTARQVGGNENLILTDIGNSNIKVTSAKIDTIQGTLMFQWSGCNIYTEKLLEENGFGICRGNPINDNAHKLVANYSYHKVDADLGNLSQIYYHGNTPWNILSTGRGCAVINSPRGKDSLIKTLKFIAYNEGNVFGNIAIDWVLEPDACSAEGKELANLFDAITKRVARPFIAFAGV